MKKKLALIIISLDECFTQSGFSGGGHKVTKNLILGLVESDLFDIDIYCKKSVNSWTNCINGIKSITILSKKNFKKDLESNLKENDYDYILSSDILLPFANNIIHSNSSKYKTKNGKNPLMQKVLSIYNSKKIASQQKNMPKDKAVFTVSESLKNDYVSNFNLDEKKVFVCYPAPDKESEFVQQPINQNFTVGSIAGGGLNKGGYLLLQALWNLPQHSSIKAKVIFPKMKKSFFFKLIIKLSGLEKRVELLPKQKDMNDFYKKIDCYVLPSLNEAFGLVVAEAASNFKPSLVSSTTGVRELVEDSKNGFVFQREFSPVKNLVQKLLEIEDIYFNDNERFIQISKNAAEIATKLDWKNFCTTIIENMVGENKHD